MRLQDIADMKDYLENRCYCPYEIYDLSGFFFQIFKPDTECEFLASGKRNSINGTFVTAKPDDNSPLQIIYIEHENGIVNYCVRVDATENNKKQFVQFLAGEIEKMDIDEYSDTKTQETLNEIMSVADAVMIS